jgi:hypothetical protein
MVEVLPWSTLRITRALSWSIGTDLAYDRVLSILGEAVEDLGCFVTNIQRLQYCHNSGFILQTLILCRVDLWTDLPTRWQGTAISRGNHAAVCHNSH